jgi:hypothetical protein
MDDETDKTEKIDKEICSTFSLVRMAGLAIMLFTVLSTTKRSYTCSTTNTFNQIMKGVCKPVQTFSKTDEHIGHERLAAVNRAGHEVSIPIMTTHSFHSVYEHKDVTAAVIIQHGFARNGKEYFCTAVDALQNSTLQPEDKKNVLVVSPQVFSRGDQCCNPYTKILTKIDQDDENTWCGYPIFNSVGWLDGHKSLKATRSPGMYSYDLLNYLVERLGDANQFPNLRRISIFGFSAGAQVIMRYAVTPNYRLDTDRVHVQFIISDAASYLYFNNHRPRPTERPVKHGTADFKEYTERQVLDVVEGTTYTAPKEDWVSLWKKDSYGHDWITGWNDTTSVESATSKDRRCTEFNRWR